MTGGHVVVLGRTGRNFAAGMSGGVAYVLDVDGGFRGRCNTQLVGFDPLEEDDAELLHRLVAEHAERTGSTVAERLLADWDATLARFVKVMPHDFKAARERFRDRPVSAGGVGFVTVETEDDADTRDAVVEAAG
jgi:glutamate synthase domain-containing protein 3